MPPHILGRLAAGPRGRQRASERGVLISFVRPSVFGENTGAFGERPICGVQFNSLRSLPLFLPRSPIYFPNRSQWEIHISTRPTDFGANKMDRANTKHLLHPLNQLCYSRLLRKMQILMQIFLQCIRLLLFGNKIDSWPKEDRNHLPKVPIFESESS